MGFTRRQVGFLWTLWWRPVLTLLFPLILSSVLFWKGITLPMPPVNSATGKPDKLPPEQWKQARAVFIVALMGCYWVSECLPLPVTALCPVFLLPLMEIASTDAVAAPYLNASVMLLTAGCIMAQAFEYSNLHTRIALKVACIVGARLPLLLGGMMFTSMFLSMWMNNTSTTSMMIPILAVMMGEFEAGAIESSLSVAKPEVTNAEVKSPSDLPSTDLAPKPSAMPTPNKDAKIAETKSQDTVTLSDEEMESIKAKKIAEVRSIKIMFLLGAAWASNIGGTGILTGSATNIIAQDALNKPREKVNASFDSYNNGRKCLDSLDISFIGWMEFNVVPMLVSTVFTWIILLLWFTGMPSCLKFRKATPQNKMEAEERRTMTRNVEKAIFVKYHQLGRISLHELLVLIIFGMLVVLWATGKIGEWGWFTLKEFTDRGTPPTVYPHPAIPAVLMCMFLFVLPKEAKYYKDFANGGLANGLKDPLLPWSEAESKLPWGPLILIGGGSAISLAIRVSGLGEAIGILLQDAETLNKLPKSAYLAVILVVVAILSTIASNTATTAILSPVLIELSMTKRIHPLYLLVPAATSSSYAFILPISTPPNAIVFDKSDMTQKEMAVPGIIVTIVTNVILYAMVHTYCELIFKFNDYHDYCGKRTVQVPPKG